MEKIEIYTTPDGFVQISVAVNSETIWLNRQQMSVLFDRDLKTIGKHITNIFQDSELNKNSVVALFATTASDGKIYQVEHYNLDVIISVGYRVKSIRGTQFRQWATQRLKALLIDGIALNEKRLEQKNKQIKVFHDGIRIINRAIEEIASKDDYDWLNKFSLGLKLLDDYDHETLDKIGKNFQTPQYPTLENYRDLVARMRSNFESKLFGLEKDSSFHSAIDQIRQSVNNHDIYPSIEEKAAMLLYLIVKNHAFVDGNKRIAAGSFLLFLERNDLLYTSEGKATISNEALASLTLFVASSKPEEMETVKELLISILNRLGSY